MRARRSLDGAVVVVTGASAGVGRAAARAFAAQGANLGLIARGHVGLEAARREVEGLGGRALALPVDVSDAKEVERAADEVERVLGPIRIWVNDAMVSVFAPIAETTAEELRRVTEVTYLGCVYGTLAALKHMRPRDRGKIVQVGSALAYRSIPLQAAYCGAKHAIHGFTESLRSELLHDRSRIQVTSVHLPAMNTPQFSWSRAKLPRHPQPVPPIYQPEVAARAIVYAATHRRRQIWVAWPVAEAVFGERLAPWYLDRYLADHAYASQQTDGPIGPDRPDNLFAPIERDYGAHGAFDARSRSFSVGLWAAEHRRSLAALGAATVLGGAAVAYAMSRR